jgi:hypothetical protein
VLGYLPAHLDLEDLTDLFVDYLCPREVPPALGTCHRLVDDHLCGVCYLCEVAAVVPRLLPLPASGGPPFRAVGDLNRPGIPGGSIPWK